MVEPEDVSPEMQALMARRMRQTKAQAGAEPKDLETVARWMDGDLNSAEAAKVEARVAADPEMREVVARLRDAEGEKKVLPFQLGAKPKKKVMPAVFAAIGVLAAAAVVLIVARPSTTRTTGELGAGVGGGGLGVSLQEGHVRSDGAKAAWIVTRESVQALPTDDVDGGFVVPDEHSWCSWVIVSDWTADAAADAQKLLGAVAGEKCVLEPIDALRARLPGVTGIGTKRLP
ncbi:MAG: hypothetical protein U1F43_33210 [Myxococcota bacterium]